MSYGVLSLFILTARLRLNRRPTRARQYSTMGRVYQGCRRDAIFLRAVCGFLGKQTVKNDFQLSNFVSMVMIEVLGNANCNHNPKHISFCEILVIGPSVH